MNEHRLDSLTIPVLGAGHGGLPLPIAILLNLLAVRSITAEDRRVRRVRLVVFEGNARDLPGTTLQDVVRHVATLAQGAG